MRIRASLHLALWIGGACGGSLGWPVFAQDEPGPSRPIVGTGTCPQSSAVEKVLATLLPAAASNGPRLVATVSDHGDRYVVAVGERAKTYVDSTRNCVERARVAAVFIALVLAPDGQPSPNPSATASSAPPPSAEPSPRAPPSVPTPRVRWLQADARGALAFAADRALAAPGGELGLTAGWGPFGGVARCGWISGASMNIGGRGSVLLSRFPCALGPMLQFSPGAGRFEMDVAAGLALGAMLTSGRGFATNFDSARLEVGAHAAVDAALHLGAPGGGLAPLVGLEVTYYPVTYDLDVRLRGVASQTPSVWAGVTLGASWSVK